MPKTLLIAPLFALLLVSPVGAQGLTEDESNATMTAIADEWEATMSYWDTEEAFDLTEVAGGEQEISATETADIHVVETLQATNEPPVTGSGQLAGAQSEPTPIARQLPNAGVGASGHSAGIALAVLVVLCGLAWLAVRPRRCA
jgi:hypothetical protein